jgi:hypothetical protein
MNSSFFKEVQGLEIKAVQAYVEKYDAPFEQSELYELATNQNVVDTARRAEVCLQEVDRFKNLQAC